MTVGQLQNILKNLPSDLHLRLVVDRTDGVSTYSDDLDVYFDEADQLVEIYGEQIV